MKIAKNSFGMTVAALISAMVMLLLPSVSTAQTTTNNSCLDPAYTNNLNTVYRKWNANLIDHFYSYNPDETASGYVSEQSTWKVLATQVTGTVPVYRYYSSSITDHFYSTSNTAPAGYVSEGTVGFMFLETVPGATPLYRMYRHVNGNPANGDHLYTTSTTERDSAAQAGYQYEGIEGYVCSI